MGNSSDLKEILRKSFSENKDISINYNYDKGIIEVNNERYTIGNRSFGEVGNAVLSTLKELYGEYRTIPYSFNSEAYENEKFRAEVLALGSIGILRFDVKRKEG